jgi:hypothetical protein
MSSSNSNHAAMPPWFLALALVGIFSGSVLTYSQALDAEKRSRRPRTARPRGPRTPAPRTARALHQEPRPHETALRKLIARPTERPTPEPAPSFRPAAPPGSVHPKPVPSGVALDPRLPGILVGMGFKVPEAKEALGKLPAALTRAPLADQIKGALALLSK